MYALPRFAVSLSHSEAYHDGLRAAFILLTFLSAENSHQVPLGSVPAAALDQCRGSNLLVSLLTAYRIVCEVESSGI